MSTNRMERLQETQWKKNTFCPVIDSLKQPKSLMVEPASLRSEDLNDGYQPIRRRFP